MSFAVVPLQNTEWAEGFRTGVSEMGEVSEAAGAEGSQEGELPGGVLMVTGPLIKVTILMGIGALLTSLVSWLIRMVSGIDRGYSKGVEGSG